MRNTLEIINVNDVTVPFKDKIFEMKVSPQFPLTSQALKCITYRTNMYVYSNLYKYEGHLIECKTQTSDDINNYSVRFLN